MGAAPLVLIGGTLCDDRLWQPFLAGGQCDTLTVTAGAPPSAGPMTMQRYAGELLQRLPPVFSLAGFSLGGLVALEMIAQAPEKIDRLALISAGAGSEPKGGAEIRHAGEEAARQRGMAAHVRDDLVPRYGIRREPQQVAATLIAMAEALGPDIYRCQNDLAITRADSRPRLRQIPCPVLLVTGSDDYLCPPSRHAEIMPSLPAARRVEIPGCGHLVPLEAPKVLRGLIRGLLAEPVRAN